MIYSKKQTDDNWAFMRKGDDNTVYFEDGTTEPLTRGHYMIDFGNKYKGVTLDKVDDEWWLKMLGEKDDWFINKCLSL